MRIGISVTEAGELVSRHQRAANTQGAAANMHASASVPAMIEPHDKDLDRQALKRVAQAIQQTITPLVALERLDRHRWAGQVMHQPHALLCEITGVAHLFGGEAGLLRASHQQLKRLGFTGRLAIADTCGAAWAVAHYASPDQNTSQEIVPLGNSLSALQPLSVKALRIDPETVQQLGRLGVKTVGQLLKLPRSGLASRLGEKLVLRIAQALGQVDEPLVIHRPPPDDRETLQLEYATDDQAVLADRMDRLLKRVRAGLAARGRGALRITCRLDLATHPPLTLDVGLFAPTLENKHLMGLLMGKLQQARLPSEVTRMTVSVVLSGPLRSTQTAMFDDAAEDWSSGGSMAHLADALSGRLGQGRVQGIRLQEDPLPENAFRAVPLTRNALTRAGTPMRHPHRESASAERPTSWSSPADHPSAPNTDPSSLRDNPSPRDAMRRPLKLLSRPIPLTVVGNRTLERVGQIPPGFRLDGQLHRVARYWGPERIETGWWDGTSVRRDYFRVETDRGHWWWIFQDLTAAPETDQGTPQTDQGTMRSDWLLQGYFS